ncbi:glycosyltransferase [Cohnella phaseoli]|uniref:Glycosyltransferase involved in cell wall biosynthesis n=1 Tax=Cohnella phaseoli TaxID=456490 RepID=A0A3D9JTT2_9BACL|nr:glycosyltransferase [Cohnella phaseoli]RED76856.1 glycosyltransferase involved in cell wall biosynthesis [Cohnella phaseoli]
MNNLIAACRLAKTTYEIHEAARMLDETIFRTSKLDEVSELLIQLIQPLLNEERREPVLLFHAYGWQFGGAERLIAGLTNYLARKKYRIIVSVFEPVRSNGFQLDPSIAFVPILENDRRIERLIQLVGLLSPDIFIGHNNSIPELAAVYPVFRQFGIRTIAYTLEYYFFPHRIPELASTVIARSEALAQANASCFLTRFSANAYGMAYPNAAVMQGLTSFSVPAYDSDKRNGKTVIAVGRFSDPIKRLDRVLTAFRHLLESHPDARLLIVGPYDLEAAIPRNAKETIGELLRRTGVSGSQVRFVGEQERTQDFYSQGDVFVLTSDSEGFPLVLNEAGSYGLPAVIVDIPGLEDIIADGVNGYIVPQDDMRAMANKISALFDDSELLKRMSMNAREMVGRYSIDQVGPRWEELIRVVLSHSDQDEINRILAERFMGEVVNKKAFCRTIVKEYERTAVLVSAVPKVRTTRMQLDEIETIAVKLVNHFRDYGLRATIGKATLKLRGLWQKRFGKYRQARQ